MEIYAFIIIICASSSCFDLQCPDTSQWNKRAQGMCGQEPEKYHCFNDTNSNKMIEKCMQADDLPPGFYSVYSGNRNAKECSSERYSPLSSWSNDGFECNYKKSLCSEEGQVLYNAGSKIEDNTCSCDYKQGYAFVTIPITKCYCFPSIEDCTCHIKQCPGKSFLLNQDYICLGDFEVQSHAKCSQIYLKTKLSSDQIQKGNLTQTLHLTRDSKPAVQILCTSSVFICIICGIFYIYFNRVPQLDMILPQNIKEIRSTLRGSPVLILMGRKGTGKGTIANYLSSFYSKIMYEILTITSNTNYVLPTINCYRKYFIIFKIVSPSFSNVELIVEQVKNLFQGVKNTQKDSIVIIICERLHGELEDFLSSSIENFKELLLDLDDESFYTIADKRKMLDMHLKKRKKSTMIKPDDIDKIVQECPLLGFPLMCELFCQHDEHINQGLQFFKQPPALLVKELNEIGLDGKSNFCSAYQYCLLVSAMISKDHLKNFNNLVSDIKRMFNKLYPKFVESADFSVPELHRMAQKSVNFLLFKNGNEISFVHPAIEQALVVSLAQFVPTLVVKYCDIMHILTFLRPKNYEALKDEVVLTIDKTNYKTFAERLAKETMNTSDLYFTEKIGRHLSCWISTYQELTLLELVEFSICNKYKNRYKNILKLFLTLKHTSLGQQWSKRCF